MAVAKDGALYTAAPPEVWHWRVEYEARVLVEEPSAREKLRALVGAADAAAAAGCGFGDELETARQGLFAADRLAETERLARGEPHPTLPYLALPYLALPYLTLPYFTLPYPTLLYLTLPYGAARKRWGGCASPLIGLKRAML